MERTNMCVMLLPHEIPFCNFSTSANVRNHCTGICYMYCIRRFPFICYSYSLLKTFIVWQVWTNPIHFVIINFKGYVKAVQCCYTYLSLSQIDYQMLPESNIYIQNRVFYITNELSFIINYKTLTSGNSCIFLSMHLRKIR